VVNLAHAALTQPAQDLIAPNLRGSHRFPLLLKRSSNCTITELGGGAENRKANLGECQNIGKNDTARLVTNKAIKTSREARGFCFSVGIYYNLMLKTTDQIGVNQE
jgi:hypothetical protein